MWGNIYFFRIRVMLWFVVYSGLFIIEKMYSYGLYIVNRCLLRYAVCEDRNYLFFKISVLQRIWSEILIWMIIDRSFIKIYDELKRFRWNIRGKQIKLRIRRVILAVSVYEIWKERNLRIFREKIISVEKIFWYI